METDEQMRLAQQRAANLTRILLEASRIHTHSDYLRIAEPILLELDPLEQDIREYLMRKRESP